MRKAAQLLAPCEASHHAVCAAGGLLMTTAMLQLFTWAGSLQLNIASILPTLSVIVALSTLVESLPITRWVDDNLSVPLTAALATCVLLPGC